MQVHHGRTIHEFRHMDIEKLMSIRDMNLVELPAT